MQIEDMGLSIAGQAKNLQQVMTNIAEMFKKIEKQKESLQTEIKLEVDTASLKAAQTQWEEAIKQRFATQIEYAKKANSEEIAMLQERISAITKLMQQEAKNERNEETTNQIKKLEDALLYERDEKNLYELKKEIAIKTKELEQQKRLDSLAEEKAYLQEQIAEKQNSFDEQKALLLELREEEIRLSKQSQASLTAFLKDKEQKLTDSALKERLIVSTNTQSMIDDLLLRVADFAEAGRQAGEAYARAFSEYASHLETQIASASDSFAPVSVASGNVVNVSQTLTVPVASPSRLARETSSQLEAMLRNV